MGRGGGTCKEAVVAAAKEEGVEGMVGLGAAVTLEVRDGCARPTPLPPPRRALEPLELEPDMQICCHIHCLHSFQQR